MSSGNQDRSAIGRMGALARNAAAPTGAAITETARRNFRDSFLTGHECSLCDRVDIDQELPLAERQRKADDLYSLHMSKVSLQAAKKRRAASKWHKVGTAIRKAPKVHAAILEAMETEFADSDVEPV